MKTVTYYTHESSDANHSTSDSVALVLRESEDWLDLVVFPVGGPVQFVRAYAWDDDGPLPPPGGSYWREEGTDPPDYGKAYRHYGDERFQTLLRAQQQALAQAAPKDREALAAKHYEEQEALLSELDGGEPKAEPKPESDAARLERLAEAQRQKEARERAAGSAPTDMGRRL